MCVCVCVLQQMILLWEDQLTTLHSKVVEPMSNYVAKFPDVKVHFHVTWVDTYVYCVIEQSLYTT